MIPRRLLWSMKKEPALEASLSRNRRWIVNNQIKNFLLRSPGHTATVRSLQKKLKSFDLQGRAINWLRKYPCCFDVLYAPDGGGEEEIFFTFSKRMAFLVEEEEAAMAASEPAMAQRLAKLLMLCRDRRLNVVKLNELKRGFGFPDDYLLRLVPKLPETFRVVNRTGRRNSMEIELVRWDPDLATSAVEAAAIERGTEPRFVCSLPDTWIKTRKKFDEFNEATPYVSPYNIYTKLGELMQEVSAKAVAQKLFAIFLVLAEDILMLASSHDMRGKGIEFKFSPKHEKHLCLKYSFLRLEVYNCSARSGYKTSERNEARLTVAAEGRFKTLKQAYIYWQNAQAYILKENKKEEESLELLKDPSLLISLDIKLFALAKEECRQNCMVCLVDNHETCRHTKLPTVNIFQFVMSTNGLYCHKTL
ncbi:hypothetical protein ZIOFF_021059 [Zingiber officinale]|uniref:PORR domain-containing protein n=1 Tax=Zingiber officinale TaxID=94328 RepID=A0A8J5H0Y3_ZINOF|nr:hypothetical protein ZIOFF_021059 [Zingiber officinale]